MDSYGSAGHMVQNNTLIPHSLVEEDVGILVAMSCAHKLPHWAFTVAPNGDVLMGPAHHRQRNTFAGKVLKDKKVYCNRLEMENFVQLLCFFCGLLVQVYIRTPTHKFLTDGLKYWNSQKVMCSVYTPVVWRTGDGTCQCPVCWPPLLPSTQKNKRERWDSAANSIDLLYFILAGTVFRALPYRSHFWQSYITKMGGKFGMFFYVSKFAALSQTLWLLKRERAVQLGRSSSGWGWVSLQCLPVGSCLWTSPLSCCTAPCRAGSTSQYYTPQHFVC